MKGYAAASAAPAKRRWKCFATTVLALVFCSLLVPLAFLLGRFPSGYLTDERHTQETRFDGYRRVPVDQEEKSSGDDDARIKDLVDKFSPAFPQAVSRNNFTKSNVNKESKSKPISDAASKESNSKPITEAASKGNNSKPIAEAAHVTSEQKDPTSHSKPKDNASISEGPPTVQVVVPKAPSSLNTRDVARDGVAKSSKDLTADESGRFCQLEFGSYCLWSIEHKEVLKDAMVKRLKDQLFVARAYYPSIAKLQGQEQLTRDLKQQIQEHERMISEAISDADLPHFAGKSLQKMDQVIARAKACTVDCNNVDKKLRQILDLTEDEAHFHMKQSAFLYHLGAQTMPKSLHCLSMRLTVEYFKSTLVDIVDIVDTTDMEHPEADKHDNPNLRNYVIFSKNILAVSVAINSTVMHAEETGNIVFHILTDRQNYYAMKFWFARNSYTQVPIHVMDIEDLNLDHPYDLGLPLLSPSEEFRISIRSSNQSAPTQMKTEYISTFGHSHFLLPEIFKDLKKVIVLDDDVVVQRDLSSLWNIDLGGKVNGALEYCGVRLSHLRTYLEGSSYNKNACAWVSGLNIVDLEKWREHDVSRVYKQLLHKLQNRSEASWRAATLPISLLAFQDLVYALDESWLFSGLGHDYGASVDTIKIAAALHYNGNMKPWLDLGIPKYKKYWKQFLTHEERFMDECNVNP